MCRPHPARRVDSIVLAAGSAQYRELSRCATASRLRDNQLPFSGTFSKDIVIGMCGVGSLTSEKFRLGG